MINSDDVGFFVCLLLLLPSVRWLGQESYCLCVYVCGARFVPRVFFASLFAKNWCRAQHA